MNKQLPPLLAGCTNAGLKSGPAKYWIGSRCTKLATRWYQAELNVSYSTNPCCLFAHFSDAAETRHPLRTQGAVLRSYNWMSDSGRKLLLTCSCYNIIVSRVVAVRLRARKR